MTLRFFDFEVLPHWWLCVFGDLPDTAKTMNAIDETEFKANTFYVTSDDPDARDKLLSYMRDPNVCLMGYNVKGYDLIIANAIYQGFTPEQVKKVNDLIINEHLVDVDREYTRLAPFARRRISGCIYQDLYDSSDGTLKEKEATLGLSVLESAVDFNKEDLTDDDKADLIYYCKHDVFAAAVWYLSIVEPFVYSKLMVSKAFGVPVGDAYRCTNAQLVAKALDAHRTSFIDDDKVNIELPSKIRDYVRKNLPSKIVDYVLNNKEVYTVNLFNNVVVYADGGIHSIYDTHPVSKKDPDILYVESDDEWTLMNVDAASYYPSIMIQLDTLSRSIHNPDRFKFVFEDRVRIKHKKNKTKDDDDLQLAYKLILNTTYGASGCEFLDLCDKYQRTKTCRYGQLYLTALANKLFMTVPNLQVIQTNTDGILIYCRRKHLDLVNKLKDEWQTLSGIGMDIDMVDKIWQRDVNNYLMVKEGGKIKRKGAWLIDNYIKPGYIKISPLDAYVCGKAAIQWLVNGVDPIKYIINNKNVEDFVVTCKKGPTFKGVVQRFEDGSEQQLYKCNRVIATKDKSKGMLYKYKVVNGAISYNRMPDVPEHCLLINDDFKKYNFDDIKPEIDYVYYVQRLYDKLDHTFKQLKGTSFNIIDRFSLKI